MKTEDWDRMNHLSDSTSPKVVKKACTECRQQKAKCDKYLNPSKRCSRCEKVNAECFISDPFKRENKRRKLDELQSETQELRERLWSLDHTPPSRSTLTPPARSITGMSSSNLLSDTSAATTMMPGESSIEHTASPMTHPSTTASGSTTLPRALDHQKLEAYEIDDLFELYFRDFAQHLPILDPTRSPNAYYDASSLLFWSIIGVACRAYTSNPTLLDAMRSKVNNLAFDSLKHSPTLESVQGLLLIVNWPFPKTSSIWNPIFALTGALLHTAMGIGLHLPTAAQEFSKVKLRLEENDIQSRAETWAYCVIIYQRMCVCKGSSGLTLHDVCQDPSQRQMLFQRMDSRTAFNLKLQDILSRCCKALSENGLQEMSEHQEACLDILIKSFGEGVENLRQESMSTLDEFHTSLISLIILSFHLFRAPKSYDSVSITHIFSLACKVLDGMDLLFRASESGLKASPTYHSFALLLASQVLLRLMKCPSLASHIDPIKAKSMIYLAINLAKSMSLDSQDMISRIVKVLSQTLSSERAYKDPLNGQNAHPLRVRGRYAMSIVLDGTIWWREEFKGDNTGIYPVPLNANADMGKHPTSQTGAPSADNGMEMASIQEPVNSSFDPFFIEPGWTGFDDFFSPFWSESGSWSNMMP